MKTYDEIYDIIHNQLGLKDQASYKSYLTQYHNWGNPRIPTPEDIELLSPENVDNKAFWLVAERIFATDPVSNCKHEQAFTIEEANANNLCIYHTYGFTGFLSCLDRRWPGIAVLEVGPGYGALKGWIKTHTKLPYFAADVYRRIAGVDQNELTGLLSDVTKTRRYGAAISCNVFQHLSVYQRRRYYEDIAASLLPGGLFMFSMFLDGHPADNPGRDSLGRFWCKHYGQFTEIQKEADILADLKSHFNIVSRLLRGDPNPDEIVVTCSKKAAIDPSA